MFVRTIFSEPQNILSPNLVWLCSLISQSVMQKKLVHHLQCDYFSSKLLVRLQPNLVWWCSIISRSVLWKNGITVFKINVTVKVQNVSECLSRYFSPCVQSGLLSISWTTQPFFFFTKLSMVVYNHEAMCLAVKLVHYLQCQGHSEGLYNQNITIFTLLNCQSICKQTCYDSAAS